jgi:hypothetical protein
MNIEVIKMSETIRCEDHSAYTGTYIAFYDVVFSGKHIVSGTMIREAKVSPILDRSKAVDFGLRFNNKIMGREKRQGIGSCNRKIRARIFKNKPPKSFVVETWG